MRSKTLEKISEIYGWLQIVFSALLVAGIVGVALYFTVNKALGIIVGIILFILGIYLACSAYKGKGTIYLISRTMATPELDNKREENVVTDKENPKS